MRVVILGCGRVGSTLARILDRREHDVVMVDQDPRAFRRLDDDFRGRTVTGMGFDRDVLVEAGIESADAFAAVSSGDNSNVIAARVARETFAVERVAARIYDQRRAEVYERLGIPSVATVRWTADQLLRRLIPDGSATAWTDPSGKVVLAEVNVPVSWVGHRYRELEDATAARVALHTRDGAAAVPTLATVVQQGDVVHITVAKQRLAEVEQRLAAGPHGA